jgi:single-stranded DNA-binding protein
MIDLNETQLTGNLAADLITATIGETTVTRGRLIRGNSYKDRQSGAWLKSEPMAFDFEVWGKYGAALATAAKQGTCLLIAGAWVPNHFMKKDGGKAYGLRLRVERWQVVAQPGAGKSGAENTAVALPKRPRRTTTATPVTA